MRPPSPSSALPARGFGEAVPQGISGRTSYFQVCLVFRSEPQVIPAFFNRLGFGPPPGFTRASACLWLDHLASGLWHATKISPCSDSVSLRLRDSHPLASLHTITRRLILQKARRHRLRGSDLLRVHGFRFYFTPLAGVLFAFPSRYFCTIGRSLCLALDRGRPGFPRGFSCPAVLRIPLPRAHRFGYGAFTPSGRLSQNRSPAMAAQLSRSCNPILKMV